MTLGFLIEFTFTEVLLDELLLLDPKLSSGVFADRLDAGLGGSSSGSREGTGTGAGAGAGLGTEGARVGIGADIFGAEGARVGIGADIFGAGGADT